MLSNKGVIIEVLIETGLPQELLNQSCVPSMKSSFKTSSLLAVAKMHCISVHYNAYKTIIFGLNTSNITLHFNYCILHGHYNQ